MIDFAQGGPKVLTTTTKTPVRLYRHPGQASVSVTARRVLYDFERTRIIQQCLGLQDEVVTNWFKNPETYPVEFRSVVLCLWKTVEIRGGRESVACITWCRGLLSVYWCPLEEQLGNSFPAARQLAAS